MSKIEKITINDKSKKKPRNERAHQLKIYSIGSVLILLAIVLFLNILVDNLLGKALTFDFSVERSNTISAETEKFLNGLPADTKIRVVGLFERPESLTESETQKYLYIIPLLDDYVKKSGGRISVEYVDIQKKPGIIAELDPNSSYNLSKRTGAFVVSYNGRLDVIDPLDCYTIDTEYLETYDQYMANGNNAEYTITNSMMSLVNGFKNKAYLITGLKESTSVSLTKILNSVGVETVELPVTTDFKVPEDCDLIILNGPDTDITEGMYVELSSYISKGGRMIAAVEYSSENANNAFPNLNRLLNEYNINLEQCIVAENNPSYQLNQKSYDSLADIGPAFADMVSAKQFHITLARPLGTSSAPNAEAVATPVLTTSSTATKSIAGAHNEAQRYGDDMDAFNVGMYSIMNDGNKGQILVFGTLNFTADVYYSEFTITDKNADLLKAFVKTMLPQTASYNINIPVKKIEDYALGDKYATTANSTTMMVVFMMVLPIILSTAAVIVYNKRKNL